MLFSNLSDLKGFFPEKINARVNQFNHKIYMDVPENDKDIEGICTLLTTLQYYIFFIVVDEHDVHEPPSGFKKMDFKADHPFAFVIRDANVIYLNGHLVNP